MSSAFLGEVRLFGFNFAPKNWAWCNGQIMAIQQNTALFSIIGTYYGGNGTNTFGLPNLQNNIVVGAGNSTSGTQYQVGEEGGAAAVTLNQTELPSHTHAFQTAGVRFPGDLSVPSPTAVLAPGVGCTQYCPVTPAPTLAPMAPLALTPSGSASVNAHSNIAPTLAVNYCICVNGIFPARN